MTKPTDIGWAPADVDSIEPTAGKKAAGWASNEKPPHQEFNWIGREQDRWNKWFDDMTMKDGACNVGVVLNAGEFKLVQANGSDFSTAHGARGFIVMPSQVTPGRKVVLEVTAATHLFIDDSGASDIVGEEFGTTAGVAWGNARPFYLYAVNRDDTSANLLFAISPNPNAKVSPAGANIGYHATPAGTPSDNNFFFLTASDPTATHNAKPCLRIGGLRMTKSAADDWTVAAIAETSGDGIRSDPFVGTEFTMPTGQMGATAAKYMSDNGGTAPVFTTSNLNYYLNLDGIVKMPIYLNGDGGTDGAGAVQARIHLPYQQTKSYSLGCGSGWVISAGATDTPITFVLAAASASQSVSMYEAQGPGLTEVENGDFTNGAREIVGEISYKAF